MNQSSIEVALSLIGAVSMGYLTYRGIKYLVTKVKWRNPLKTYIRKVVLDYLNELKQ